MTRMNRLGRLVGAGALVLAAAACSDRDQARAGEEMREAGRDARQAGERAADAAREAGGAMAEAGREAGSAAAEAGREATRAAGAAMETIDVKTALMRDSRVDAGEINVDTDHETKTVILKGSVASAAQKTIAEEIARAQAVGYRIDNRLSVRG